MRYSVGDRVVVRNDLVEFQVYSSENGEFHDSVTSDMYRLRGTVVTIRQCNHETGKYRINESVFNWVDEMFDGLEYDRSVEEHDQMMVWDDGLFSADDDELLSFLLSVD